MAARPLPPLRLRTGAEPKPPTPVPVVEVRCWACGALLGEFAAGTVARIKCQRHTCKTYNVVDTRPAA